MGEVVCCLESFGTKGSSGQVTAALTLCVENHTMESQWLQRREKSPATLFYKGEGPTGAYPHQVSL